MCGDDVGAGRADSGGALGWSARVDESDLGGGGVGAMWFAVYGESLNVARFVGFCRRLLDDVGGSVVLVGEADLQVVRWSPGLAVVVAPVLAGAGGGCGWRVLVAPSCLGVTFTVSSRRWVESVSSMKDFPGRGMDYPSGSLAGCCWGGGHIGHAGQVVGWRSPFLLTECDCHWGSGGVWAGRGGFLSAEWATCQV